MSDLHAWLSQFHCGDLSLYVIDIGAASMGEGTDPYAALTRQPGTHVTGFEPNAAACEARNAGAPPTHTFLPYFIGDGAKRKFHACANPLTSSLYAPNKALLDLFQRLDLPQVGSEEVQTRRLDAVFDGDVDYLKIDVQGAELDVIRGAAKALSRAVLVHTEVEFVPMYQDQPLFGDIDVELRRHGYLLHNFVGPFSRQMKPVVFNNDPFHAGSQLIYAEAAVYIRDMTRLAELPAHKLARLMIILHTVYGSIDFAAHVASVLGQKLGRDLVNPYIAFVSGQAAKAA
jgi:FkbM family methyltransferase